MAITNFTRSWKDLITSVRTLLDEDSAGFYTDDMIFRLLVDAQMRIAQKASVRYEATGKLPKLFRDCVSVVRGTANKFYTGDNYLYSLYADLSTDKGEKLVSDDIYMLLAAKVKYSFDSTHIIDNVNLGEQLKDMIDVPVLPPDKFMSENNYIDGVTMMPDTMSDISTSGAKRVNKIYFKSNVSGDKYAEAITFVITYVSIWTDYDLFPVDYREQIYGINNVGISTPEVSPLGDSLQANVTTGRFNQGILPPYCHPAMTEYAYASILRRDREMIPFAMQSLARAEKLMEECVG